MKFRRLFIWFSAVAFLFFSSCEKNKELLEGQVELYLLNSFKTLNNSCQIDESTAVANKEPLLAYSDMVSYDTKTYSFRLSNNGKQVIIDKGQNIHGNAFAVFANNELIYTGYFWAGFSSSSCQWIVTDPMHLPLSDEMKMNLGYPGQIDGIFIPDNRNDPRILAIFRKDGKLIE